MQNHITRYKSNEDKLIKTSNDILYNRLKNSVGFDKSKKFKKWFHENYPGREMHHLFKSYSQSLKTSDYCSVPVTREEHLIAEKNSSDYAIDNLHIMIKVMIKYILFLEGK